MTISSNLVVELRNKTGLGMMDCKKALVDCDGDIEKAVEYLRKKGLSVASKKAERVTSNGIIESYIHMGGKIGVLVELNCETDFVARTDEFKILAHELAMQVAATNPKYFSREDVPSEVIEKEKEIYRMQCITEKKPESAIEKIVLGKVERFFNTECFLEQSFIKEPDKKVQDIITENIAKLGENIKVKRFVRYLLGEDNR